ncbi:MAG: flagellar basal-body MS-ring/collar protein FliF [Syntrophomonadaceae bacterium]|nr:flagellar basal-body MS-ring/collar protein FliF [Syntrophomonadaceae bacterium]
MALLNRLKDHWQGLSSTKKSIYIVAVVCLLLSSFFFYRWATRVEYAPLFSNIQNDAAGKIVEELKAMNVPYVLEDGGKTISVPVDQVYELRLNLASKGIISEGGIGFELFNTSDISATDFERNVNYQRALQEELRRTIDQLDAVKECRVHLVLPEKSAFIENDRKAQASIVLELKPMAKLEPEQIKGIAALLVGAVQNLNLEDVKIIDTAGHVLSDQINESGSSAVQMNQMELKRDFEKDLETRVQQMLDSIYGPNKAVTMITANLDFNQKEVNRIIWGDQGVVTSEQLSETRSGNAGSSGIVGDTNRDPDAPEVATNDNGVTDMTSTKNYEINKTEEKEIYAPGRVISISTAVAINGDLPADAEMRIRDIISAAIGFDSNRGDIINVLSTEFDQTSLEQEQAEMAQAEADAAKQAQIEKLVTWGLKGLGIILLFILALTLIRTVRSHLEEPDELLQEPVSIKKVEEQLEQMERPETFATEDEEIKKIMKESPEVAAQIINNWLDETGSGVSG